MPAVRIRVQLLADDDSVVHEYQRATTFHQTDSLWRMCEGAMGWLQAYGSQATREQWAMEVERIRRQEASLQALSESSPES